MSDIFPDDNVKFPKSSFITLSQRKFLVSGIVVSPLILTAPDEVLNNPVEEEASKFPEDWHIRLILIVLGINYQNR